MGVHPPSSGPRPVDAGRVLPPTNFDFDMGIGNGWAVSLWILLCL